MPVIASFDTEIKISGLSIPITFDVIDALGYDCLVGISFLEDTLAEISLASNTLTLYGGLISVPMTRLASVINTVYTITDVVIPAFSECLLPVSTFKQPLHGPHIIEENLQSPCRALMVARALVDPAKRQLPSRVLNPTDKAITLRAKTPIGELAPVTIASATTTADRHYNQLPSVDVKLQALEAKQI